MKKLLILSMLLFAVNSEAKITVAVIDTGLESSVIDLSGEPSDEWYKKGMCKYGHKDFSGAGTLDDTHGHGTHVSSLIHKYAKGSDYCQVIIRYWMKDQDSQMQALLNSLRYAIDIKVDIINVSLGGPEPNEKEHALIKEALSKGIKIIAAAGNNGLHLRRDISYYPAMYEKDVIVVGSVDSTGRRSHFSNYDPKIVDRFEFGEYEQGEFETKRFMGTSQATAVATGKEISIMHQVIEKMKKIILSGKGLG